MKNKKKLNLPAIMLIFLGIIIIIFAIAFTILDPSRTVEQVNNMLRLKRI